MTPATRSGPERALAGVRVVALEASVAGPFCSRILGDMGADVIKVEKPGEGDLIRHWDAVARGLSSGYVWLSGNKRSVTIDVKHRSALEIMHRLVQRADVFVENSAPGVADRLGLGAAEMCRLNPRLIYCSISGYGQNGPYRDVKAYDLLIQGEAGVIGATGYPDRPAKVAVPISDLAAAMYAALGIVLALYQREHTGRGQQIDIAMFDAMVSFLGYFPHYYWHRGEEPARMGMRHHYVTPYGPYLASDGAYVNVAVATATDWEVFCRAVLEAPELLEDPRYDTVARRVEHREALEAFVAERFLKHPHQEWLRRLKACNLPHGEVRTISQVLSHPQALARGLIREILSPVGTIPTVGSARNLSDSPARYDRIPALGEDTEAVLRELGYDGDAVGRMRREKVI